MKKVISSVWCKQLSLILAIAMIVSIIAPAVYGDDSTPKNSVIISNTPGAYKISAGKGDGMEVGAKGIISRDGKDLAKFEVTTIEWGYSDIKVSDLAPGETIRLDDSAKILDIPAPPKQKVKNDNGGKALLALLVVGAIVALGGGHHGGGSSSPANTQSLTFAVQNTSLPADGTSTSTITVTVVNSNNSVVADGTSVLFSTSAGSISPAQATTTGGKATATLTAGTTAGSAVVTATIGSKHFTQTIAFVPSNSGSKGSIQLSASPTSIQVLNSGGAQTQSTITATCLDALGHPATSGTVTFTSTLGSVVGTGTINANGIATSTFNSSLTGQAQITASWSGAQTNSSVPVTVTAGPPYAITIQCNPASVECDGHAFAVVSATVKDIAGNMVTDGTTVDFTVTPDATGGGNGSITPQTRTTNGVATSSLFTRTPGGTTSIPGTATVGAQVKVADQQPGVPVPATDLSVQKTYVQFVSQDVAFMNLGANPTNIRGWDYVNNTTTITAIVYDSKHNPVPDGTAVYFTANHGMIYGNAGMEGNVAVSTTKLGIATATLASDASGSPAWNGHVDVTATSGAQTVTAIGLVTFSGYPSIPHCRATINPDTLDSVKGQAVISVLALDVNNNPVVDGTSVTATTNKGTLAASGSGTVGGAIEFTLTTSQDASTPTQTGPGTVTVTISSGGHNPETGDQPVQLSVSFTVQATP